MRMQSLVIVVGLLLANMCAAGEPDFTMRDSNGKVVTWKITQNDNPSKGECPTDLFKGTEAVMAQFGLTQVKLLPMCGEKVSFFKDTGVMKGVTYILEGAEYSGPWGVRCAFATANAEDGTTCPQEIEVALHVAGKFRYCLWGGDWMCRRTFTYEYVPTGEGEMVIDWAACQKAADDLVAAGGVTPDQAMARAMEDPKNRKLAQPWGPGVDITRVDGPLPEGMVMDRLTVKRDTGFATVFACTTFTKVQVKVPETTFVSSNQVSERLTSGCTECKVDRSMLTEKSLRAAGFIADNEKLEKVLFMERQSSSEDVILQEIPLNVVVKSKVVEKTYAKTTIYPTAVPR
jgi:hypothetical protein